MYLPNLKSVVDPFLRQQRLQFWIVDANPQSWGRGGRSGLGVGDGTVLKSVGEVGEFL